jgi:uncharacterized membrane protein YhaH (DUF805 family)
MTATDISAQSRYWTVDRLLLVLVSVVTLVGALVADALGPGAAQHIDNPNWPPHAKFHDAQYIVMSMLLAGIALVVLSQKAVDRFATVGISAAMLSTPWMGMLGALLFPGTSMLDPEFDQPSAYVVGVHPQILIAAGILLVLAIAVTVAARRKRNTGMPAH